METFLAPFDLVNFENFSFEDEVFSPQAFGILTILVSLDEPQLEPFDPFGVGGQESPPPKTTGQLWPR